MDYTIENMFRPLNPAPNEGRAAFALYINPKDADLAIMALKRNGFSSRDFSLLTSRVNGDQDFVYQQKYSIFQGTLIGAAVGMTIVGFLGFLFGAKETATNAYSFNPLGFQSSMGTAIVGAIMGLIFGAACGALVGIGAPKSAAKRYGFYLKEGGIVLVVHLKNEAERGLVHKILEKTRGQDISVLDEDKIWSTIIPEKERLIFH